MRSILKARPPSTGVFKKDLSLSVAHFAHDYDVSRFCIKFITCVVVVGCFNLEVLAVYPGECRLWYCAATAPG